MVKKLLHIVTRNKSIIMVIVYVCVCVCVCVCGLGEGGIVENQR